MTALAHSLMMFLSIAGVYAWLHSPALTPYSLQAFTLVIIIYFILKRIKKAKLWHVLPANMSTEVALATFAFLLLIGSTGNIESIFYPLTFIHLFFIVFSSQMSTTLFSTALIMLFHYGLELEPTTADLNSVLTIPIIMGFFVFAKLQYEEALREKSIIEANEKELEIYKKEDSAVRVFFEDFLKKKFDQLSSLLTYPEKNKDALKGQINLIQIEIEKLLRQIKNS